MAIKKIIKQLIPKPTLERYGRSKIKEKYADRFETAINQFVIEKGITDPNVIQTYRKRMEKAFVKDNWYPDEYFFFNYELLSRKGIHQFVPNREAHRFWTFMNSKKIYDLTCDKWLTYQHFKKFFQRDVVALVKGERVDFQPFINFAKKHDRFIVKPTFGNLGNGVRIVNSAEYSDKEQLGNELLNEYVGGFIAEELIVQCDEMASFHASSVNTIRVTTVRQSNGEVYIIHRPFMRMGQGGRCVDNGGNYGIFGAIDFETGIIRGAIDERMNKYVVHPDSGKTILGFQIPRWEEAKSFVVELANVMPDLKYCGWDLALTDKGWVMVEANGKGLFIGFQMPTQEGFRKEFEQIKLKCGYKG